MKAAVLICSNLRRDITRWEVAFVDASFTLQLEKKRTAADLSDKNGHNYLPEGDSDIMFCSLRFSLPAQNTFTCKKKGDGAAWG